VIIRTDATVAPCFPMYASTYHWGTSITTSSNPPTGKHEEDLPAALLLNPNLAKGGARSFEDQECIEAGERKSGVREGSKTSLRAIAPSVDRVLSLSNGLVRGDSTPNP
jgi:hypothetical protein